MRDLIRVLILGTGQMGSGIARLVLEKKGLQLVGAYGRRAERAGMDIGRAIGLEHDLGIPLGADLSSLIEQTQPHVAIQATCSRLDDAKEEITLLIEHGVSVISIAEEMAYPAANSPLLAKQLHQLAIKHGVAVLGTGINPGFVMDLLIITLSGVCSEVQTITAKRVNDLSPYGPTVLASQGVGLTPVAFDRGLKDGTVTGHIGFVQSIHMIASALGWEIDHIEQLREPILTQVRRETPFTTIEPGQVIGCLHTASAYRQGKPVITLVHPQQIDPQSDGLATGDEIEIRGTPNIKFAGKPEIPGGQGTAAVTVNMIPRILNAAAGLYSMMDLPVPAAMLGDARKFVHRD
jgi:hypothetical protein